MRFAAIFLSGILAFFALIAIHVISLFYKGEQNDNDQNPPTWL